MSSKFNVPFGVRQGSILGPIFFLLFTIYVNDLATHVNDCLLIQYADDTQFIISDSIETLAGLRVRGEQTLRKIKSFFDKNGLLLNMNKTKCMFTGSRTLPFRIPSDIAVHAGDTRIHPCDSLNNLGEHFDKHTLFDTHITQVTKKAFGTLMYINRIKEFFLAVSVMLQ